MDGKHPVEQPHANKISGAPPLVALGGSAGSLDAILHFFSVMPENCGLSFVVVLHLPPNQDSNLPELIERRSRLKAIHARHDVAIEANHVYVIPPGRLLRVKGTRLELTNLELPQGVRSVVDILFNSIADQCGPRAAAVVLSGADSDGAAGMQRIKLAGGRTLAQDPDEAPYSGMPQAAIATGCVDAIVPTADLPGRILDHFGCTAGIAPPATDTPPPPPRNLTPDEDTFVTEVLSCVRQRTGRDIGDYSRVNMMRWLERRMQIARCDHPQQYLEFLRADAREPQLLLRELLVSVTTFFRDPHAFAALSAYVPQLFEGKGRDDFVRVWTPACATGEEAYSIAMLLLEHARTLPEPPTIQVFACDLDEAAIEVARAGIYPEKIADSLGAQRLGQFFTKERRGYRVRRELRQAVLFAVQDILKDAPFARMDMVTCRNLLIFLSPAAKERMLGLFQFALKERGLLFLGTSEKVDRESPLFHTLDSTNCIYRRLPRKMPLSQYADARALLQAGEACSGRRRIPLPEPSEPSATGMQASNHELQVMNQELRCATEELEVNRQELQSINEELSVVNQELSTNINDLGKVNTDLQNLIDATAIPTVFLDLELCVMRYTPDAVGLFRLIPSDVGRPLADLRDNLDYPALLDDARRVLAAAEAIQKEVRDTAGRSFLARILPYRTREGAIAGVVLTFIEITARKQAEEALRVSEQRVRIQKEALQASVNGEPLAASLNILTRIVKEEMGSEVRSAFYLAYPDGASLHAIDGAGDMRESYTKPVDGFLVGEESFACGLAIATGRPVLTRDVFEEPEWKSYVHLAKEHNFRSCGSYPIMTREGKAIGTFAMYFTQVRDATRQDFAVADAVTPAAAIIISRNQEAEQRNRAEDAMRTSEEKFRALSNATPALVWVCKAPSGENIYFNDRWHEYTGQTRAESAGYGWTTVAHPEDWKRIAPLWERCQKTGEIYTGEVRYRRHDGEYRWFTFRALPTRNDAGEIEAWYGTSIDIHDQKQAEEAVRNSQAWLAGQKEAFQVAMSGAPLEASLNVLVRMAAEQTGGHSRAAFYRYDSAATVLHHVTGMSEEYARAVDRFKVGPEALACGLATYTGEPVITPDVMEEPRWEPWRWLAKEHGYRGCWSFPLRIAGAPTVGTFAMYFREPRKPSERELELGAVVAHAGAIIISRHNEAEQRKSAEEALRESEAKLTIEPTKAQQERFSRNPLL
jgi:PAS domain S-box-containing protein